MTYRRPFIVVPRFAGTSFVVVEPGTPNEDVLAAVAEGLTVVVVAESYDGVADADRILVLDDGRVVEDGSPAELVATGGVYARLRREWQYGAEPDQPASRLHSQASESG